MLHTDSWPSRQSETSLNRMHLCKYSEAVTWLLGNHGRYDMIYADVHVRVSVSVSHESVRACIGVELGDTEPYPQRAKRSLGEERLSTSRLKRRRKALKITQRGMVKRRRSYGSIEQSVFVSVSKSVGLSHTKKNKKTYAFIMKVLFFSHHEYTTEVREIEF